MSTPRLAIWSMLGLVMGVMMGVVGSTTYYQATDPASGRAHYATKVNGAGGTGAVRFEDKNSGSTGTLQSSEAKEIAREEFDAALNAPARATGEAPAQK